MGTAYQIQDQSALYFATFQVVGWADIFTRNCYNEIIVDSFKFCQNKKGLMVYAYVIMSNHVHCIISSQNGKLSETVRDFKKFTARAIFNEMDNSNIESRRNWLNMIFEYHARFNKRVEARQFWTYENHFVELTSNEMMESKLEYIHQNPVRARVVNEPEHYVYSSASNYAGLDSVLDVEFLE